MFLFWLLLLMGCCFRCYSPYSVHWEIVRFFIRRETVEIQEFHFFHCYFGVYVRWVCACIFSSFCCCRRRHFFPLLSKFKKCLSAVVFSSAFKTICEWASSILNNGFWKREKKCAERINLFHPCMCEKSSKGWKKIANTEQQLQYSV